MVFASQVKKLLTIGDTGGCCHMEVLRANKELWQADFPTLWQEEDDEGDLRDDEPAIDQIDVLNVEDRNITYVR